MKNKTLTLISLGTSLALAGLRADAQTPRPLTQEDLLRQVDSLSPASADPGRRATTAAGAAPNNLALLPEAKGTGKTDPPMKKAKGPTEIVALEATFEQKAHVAVFIGQVVVTDPEFTVQCDKLTAFLKHDDKTAPEGAPTRLKPAPTPEPAPDAKKGKSGGLDRAIAEANPGAIVTVTQEKLEADGSTSRSIGHGKKATYDATSGDIYLYGKPDVQQGVNTCAATEEGTIMVLNRDGRMRVTGPHKTVIKDQGDVTK